MTSTLPQITLVIIFSLKIVSLRDLKFTLSVCWKRRITITHNRGYLKMNFKYIRKVKESNVTSYDSIGHKELIAAAKNKKIYILEKKYLMGDLISESSAG